MLSGRVSNPIPPTILYTRKRSPFVLILSATHRTKQERTRNKP
jgi:hypothetical protein